MWNALDTCLKTCGSSSQLFNNNDNDNDNDNDNINNNNNNNNILFI